jgi:hypothetical protein
MVIQFDLEHTHKMAFSLCMPTALPLGPQTCIIAGGCMVGYLSSGSRIIFLGIMLGLCSKFRSTLLYPVLGSITSTVLLNASVKYILLVIQSYAKLPVEENIEFSCNTSAPYYSLLCSLKPHSYAVSIQVELTQISNHLMHVG